MAEPEYDTHVQVRRGPRPGEWHISLFHVGDEKGIPLCQVQMHKEARRLSNLQTRHIVSMLGMELWYRLEEQEMTDG